MKKSLLSIIITVALIALMLYTALFGFAGIDSVQNGVVLGLDLVGGSEITYEAVIPAGMSAEDLSAGMAAAQAMLRQRLTNLGFTEASVYTSGERRITVEIPAVDDPELAVQMLGTMAEVEFQDADGTVWLKGTDIESAAAQYGPVEQSGVNAYYVSLNFTSEGQKKFAEATKAVANRPGSDNYVAIVMDGTVISSPMVSKTDYAQTGINSKSAIITMGDAGQEEVTYLAGIISSGALPFTLENIKLQSVGATLGEKSLETSLYAGLIGIILVMVFMLALYRLPGLVSCVSLAFFITLFVNVLSIAKVNLSLPGIAGIILTIGMAVDANVIIFERIKEELKAGKILRAAIDAGYNRAFAAIVDSNVTTAIAAVVLWWKGTGTIVGFAVTLLIGVILSMFTMLVITKLLLKAMVGMKITNKKLYGYSEPKPAKRDRPFGFIKNFKIFGAISVLLVIVGVIGIVALPFGVNLFNFDIDFLGGVTMQYDIRQPITTEIEDNIRAIVRDVTGSDPSSVTTAGTGGTEVAVKTLEIDTTVRNEIFQRLKTEYGLEDTDLISSSYVSSSVGADLRNAAIVASLLALVMMLVYITIRFELRSGIAAVAALAHDLLVMLSFYIILQIPFNMNFIAAALTIVGYSINATIVIFDRIRENLRLDAKAPFALIVDKSIEQTLSRSINTSLTTLFTIVMVLILGVPSIQNFALPLVIGIIAGAYSSIFVSGPVWNLLRGIGGKKEGRDKTVSA